MLANLKIDIRSLILCAVLSAMVSGCPNELYCRQCDFDSNQVKVCKKCEFSYFNPAIRACDILHRKSQRKDCIEYVQISSTEQQCKTCAYGYRLTETKSCEKCDVENCAKCDAKNTCSACFDGRAVEENQCTIKGKCGLDRCSICEYKSGSGDVKCLQCESGFALDRHGMCTESPAYCQQLDPIYPEICKVCNSGYYITEKSLCRANYPRRAQGAIWWTLLLMGLILLIAAFYMCREWRISRAKQQSHATQSLSEYFVE